MSSPRKPSFIRILIILPVFTLGLYIGLGATGFPPQLHMWLAILESAIVFPGALLAHSLLYQRMLVMIGLATAGNEAAQRLAASLMTDGLSGPGLTLWITYVIFISGKLAVIWTNYKVLSPLPTSPEKPLKAAP